MIPFTVQSKMDDLTPAERRRADSDPDVAIKEASAAAPLLITLGVSLTSESSLCELDDILTCLHCILPSAGPSRGCLYAWLLLATLKVCSIQWQLKFLHSI